MHRFYFHLWLGDRHEFDDIGTELASAEEAYMQAFHAAQDSWIELIRARRDPRRHRFDVTDESGHVLFELPFVEVISNGRSNAVLAKEIGQSFARNHKLVSAVTQEIWHTLRTSRALLDQLSEISRSR